MTTTTTINQKYKYYENGHEEVFTIEQLKEMYSNDIDKTNFSNFKSWLDEMVKMQILILN